MFTSGGTVEDVVVDVVVEVVVFALPCVNVITYEASEEMLSMPFAGDETKIEL